MLLEASLAFVPDGLYYNYLIGVDKLVIATLVNGHIFIGIFTRIAWYLCQNIFENASIY